MNIFIDSNFEKYYKQYPLRFVDIGASGGINDLWQIAARYLQVIGFEPDEREFMNLSATEISKKIKYYNTALYEKATTIPFYLTKKQMVSSIFKPNRSFLDDFPDSNRFDIEKITKLKADCINNIFMKNHIQDVDFIKIDTQGSELSILKGGDNILKNEIFGLEIEVEFSTLYENQPLFSDVDKFLRKYNFQLFDLKHYYWKRKLGQSYGGGKGQLIFADALYFRNLDKFNVSICQGNDDLWKKTKVLRAISICFMYGYFDYAFQIVSLNTNLFSDKENLILKKFFNRNVSLLRKIPLFPGRAKIADIFYKLWKILDCSSGWASCEKRFR